ERQGVAEAQQRLRAEGHMLLLEEEAVQPRGLLQRERGLGHHLGPAAVAGEAGDRVAPRAHQAFTSSKTSFSVTALRVSASCLKRLKASWSSSKESSIPANSQARAKAWRPECLPSGSVIVRPSSAG